MRLIFLTLLSKNLYTHICLLYVWLVCFIFIVCILYVFISLRNFILFYEILFYLILQNFILFTHFYVTGIPHRSHAPIRGTYIIMRNVPPPVFHIEQQDLKTTHYSDCVDKDPHGTTKENWQQFHTNV